MLAARQTRKRAAGAGSPRAMERSESQPPAKPPTAANTGGIHTYRTACCSVRPRAHHVERGQVEPEVVADHAERVGNDEDPKPAIAQHRGARARVLFRRVGRGHAARDPAPERDPGEAERASGDEGVAPAVVHGDPYGQRGSNDLAQADAGLIDSVSEGALAGPKVFVDGLSSRGDAGGFGRAKHGAPTYEASESGGQAGGDPGAGPEADRERDHPIQAEAIDQDAGERRGGGVSETEGAGDPAVILIVKRELLFDHGRERGECGAVQYVDRGGEDEDPEHQPSVAGGARGIAHWKSMVATSPAVASLEFAFAKYSTAILRGFCTPQPSVTSPEPV